MSRQVFLLPGKLAVFAGTGTISTVLGSCVAVALFDRERGVGGLNHFLLPELPAGEAPSLRYGSIAIPDLITAVCSAGARRGRLQAAVFGGGSLLGGSSVSLDIGARNVALALKLLTESGIPIVEQNVGGNHGRKIRFSAESLAIHQERTMQSVTRATAFLPAVRTASFPLSARSGRPAILSLETDVLGVGGNSSWPHLLMKLVRALSFESAPLVVAHSTVSLVMDRFLSEAKPPAGVSVHVARDGVALRRGRVYVIPHGHHGRVLREGEKLSLSVLRGSPIHEQTPSSSALFLSLADAVGNRGAGLLLGGRGEDGLAGLAALKACGGKTFAENPATTPFPFAPEKARASGAAQEMTEASDLFQALKKVA